MRLHLPRRRFWRLAIYVACLLLVLLALDMILAQARRTIHPSYETTRIVAPTRDNGTIDYLAAVEQYFGRGVTRENNAAPLLLEAFGRAALPSTQPPDGITARLGMPHLPERGDYLVTFDAFATSHGNKLAADYADPTRPETWPATDSPLVIDWLAANAKPLALIEQATHRPRCFIPFDGGNPPPIIVSVILPHLNLMRGAGFALLVRSRSRLAANDLDGCLADLRAAHRLARLLGQAPTLVERSVGMALETGACRMDRIAAVSGKFPAPQAKARAAELASMPGFPSPADAIDIGERYMMLDSTQFCARATPREAGQLYHDITGFSDLPWPGLFRFLPIPYEQSMIVANEFYDGLLTALRQPTYAQRRSALGLYERTLAARRLGKHPDDPMLVAIHGVDVRSLGNYLSILSPEWSLGVFLPAISRIQDHWESTRAEGRLSQTAWALAAFKAEHGSWPAALSELSPDDLPEVPLDPYSDRPLIYARHGAGYLLYSVGPNQTDDGGNPTAPADDIPANTP